MALEDAKASVLFLKAAKKHGLRVFSRRFVYFREGFYPSVVLSSSASRMVACPVRLREMASVDHGAPVLVTETPGLGSPVRGYFWYLGTTQGIHINTDFLSHRIWRMHYPPPQSNLFPLVFNPRRQDGGKQGGRTRDITPLLHTFHSGFTILQFWRCNLDFDPVLSLSLSWAWHLCAVPKRAKCLRRSKVSRQAYAGPLIG